MGHEPLTKYVSLSVVLLQFVVAYLLRYTHPLSWKFIVAAYIIGGTANHNLFLAIHEITHNLAFKGIKANKMLAIAVNLPIGIPYAVSFKVISNHSLSLSPFGTLCSFFFSHLKKHCHPYSIYAPQGYHLEHHKYLGEDGVDTDLPTHLELVCLNNVLGEVFFW